MGVIQRHLDVLQAACLAIAAAVPLCVLLAGGCHLVAPYDPTGGRDAAAADSRADTGSTPLINGSPCKSGGQCRSGACADGVCCNTLCKAGCVACTLPGFKGQCRNVPLGQDPRGACQGTAQCGAKACDGKGACEPALPATTACGAKTCSNGQLTSYRCDGKGSCDTKQPIKTPCAGYPCGGKGACASSCVSTSDCAKGFYCDNKVCRGNLVNGKACGKNPAACASGKCVDGVCCATDCAAGCMACNVPKHLGSCHNVPLGQDPRNACAGTSQCGKDVCAGDGKCAAAKTGTQCLAQCSPTSPTTLVTKSCASDGTCSSTQVSLCGAYKCSTISGKAQCRTTCDQAVECAEGSLCDRSKAHKGAGKSYCVSPSAVVVVDQSKGQTITAALAQVGASGKLTHVRLEAGTYNEPLRFNGITATVIGVGGVTLKPGKQGINVVAVSITSLATLQDVTVTGASGTSPPDGVRCKGASTNRPALLIFDSVITGNDGKGINSEDCQLMLRRTHVLSNKRGGVDHEDGGFIIVNSVVADNGGSSSELGGLKLEPGSGPFPWGTPRFVNNTVRGNKISASEGNLPAVHCKGGTWTIYNSILYDHASNGYGLASDGCKYAYTDVFPGKAPAGQGNLALDPKLDSKHQLNSGSPCLDVGATSGVDSVIDAGRGPRIKNAKVDLGAYER